MEPLTVLARRGLKKSSEREPFWRGAILTRWSRADPRRGKVEEVLSCESRRCACSASASLDHPDFIFEPKIDGFRALAYVDGPRCRLISRNGHEFKSWPQLAEEIAHAVRAKGAVLDGEICCLDSDGRSNCNALLFQREWPYFYAFDTLSLEGEDLTPLPLLERKRLLASAVPKIETRLLCLDHIQARGRDLYRVACDRDLEGIVAKWARGTYQTDGGATS